MLQADDIITLAAGRYRLRAQLAGSNYGLVWRAGAPDGADVALKLVNRTQMERAQGELQQHWRASAAREISFLRALSPWDERHIVRLIDCGDHDGLPVMALELMGGDLARHIAGAGPIPFAQVLAWMGQLNQALAKVHQYGWVYLDLKPANVLTDRSGAVKLADFGTSRLRHNGAHASYAGTASWQAPEQFFPNRAGVYDTDARSDYFALGAMFYFMATGGVQLRFCSDCGQAYREHGADAAAMLHERHGGGMPPTLHADEAARFATIGGQHALALLRTLLAPERCARPRHAIDISRMLERSRSCGAR
ncbi:MAG: serine/threonine-protein kinase [Pseudomonadota bacterium]